MTCTYEPERDSVFRSIMFFSAVAVVYGWALAKNDREKGN